MTRQLSLLQLLLSNVIQLLLQLSRTQALKDREAEWVEEDRYPVCLSDAISMASTRQTKNLEVRWDPCVIPESP